jgi:hypothetical protein
MLDGSSKYARSVVTKQAKSFDVDVDVDVVALLGRKAADAGFLNV